jgi:hypothetical protein
MFGSNEPAVGTAGGQRTGSKIELLQGRIPAGQSILGVDCCRTNRILIETGAAYYGVRPGVGHYRPFAFTKITVTWRFCSLRLTTANVQDSAGLMETGIGPNNSVSASQGSAIKCATNTCSFGNTAKNSKFFSYNIRYLLYVAALYKINSENKILAAVELRSLITTFSGLNAFLDGCFSG